MSRPTTLIDYGPFTPQQWIRIRTFLGVNRVPKEFNATIFKQLRIAFARGLDMADTTDEEDQTEYQYQYERDEFVNSFKTDVKVAMAVKMEGGLQQDEALAVANGLLEHVFAYVAGVTGA